MYLRFAGFFFFYFSIIGVYIIFLPKILQILSYKPFEIGVIFAIAPLTRFLVPFLFQRRFKLTIFVFYLSLGLAILSAIIFYFTIENFYLFIFPNFLLGASLGLILPFLETYALEYLGKEHYGKARLFGSIGFMSVGIVLAKLLQNVHMGLHFFLGSVLLMTFFGFTITRKNSDFSNAKVASGKLDFKPHFGFWLNLFFMQMSFGAFYNFFTIYQTDAGISLELTSWMWAFGVICEILLFYFQGYFIKRYELLDLIEFSTLMTSIRWFLLFAFPGYIFIAFFAQAFHAFSFALHHSAAFSYLHTIYSNRRLAAQFYYGISFGLGGFMGALISGWIYGPYLYLGASFMALFGLFTCKAYSARIKLRK
jgi:PPP family 3-phenylpropionic acid transporter